jgi:hypothetical protein
VSLDGDEAAFREVEERYTASPERARVFETFPDCVAGKEIGFARSVV